MIEKRSAFSPLDWEQGKNDGQFVRVRIASSADIIPQKWQTKTEIPPPLLFRSSERWLCDWSDGDFEEGKFSIDDNATGENYTLTLKFRSRVAPIDFQAWYNQTLRKQQVCLELHDANGNERVFNPFDVSYKVSQQQLNGDMTEYELLFIRSKLIQNKDRIVSVLTDCDSGITKFVFANGKPEIYDIAIVSSENQTPVFFDAATGIENIADGKYIGYARLKSDFESPFLKIEFEVKCNASTLEILEIEEVFESNLKILEIEEITSATENQGVLISGNINTIEDVCEASVANGRVERVVYFYDSPKIGTKIYSNEEKTVTVGQGIYGIKFEGKTYKVQINNSGDISVFNGQCTGKVYPKRFIAYQLLMDEDIVKNLPHVKQQVDEMVEAGVNFLAFTIQIDYIFQSLTMLNNNSSPSWAFYDEFIQHVASKNLPVGIRVHMSIDDNYAPNFYDFDKCEQDEWGFMTRNYYGATLPSMAYETGVNILLDFLRKVMDRVYPVIGDNLYFISPTISSTQEFGGNMINRQWPNDAYFAFYDYNEMNKAAFRNEMEQNYGTIDNLKQQWGNVAFGYSSFADVQPPTSNVSNRFSSSVESIRYMFTTKRGRDWWKFNYLQRKRFGLKCKDIIKSYSQNIKLCLEYGSLNDDVTYGRLGYNVPELCTWADIVKADFSTISLNPTQNSISADWINSLSNKPKFSEIATFDAGDVATANDYIRQALENGLQYASFIVAKNLNDLNGWEAYKSIIRNIASEYINKDIEPIVWQGEISTTMSECISNFTAVRIRYFNAGGSRTKRIKINLTDDL